MEALHQNSFNVLLRGKSKGRGQGLINYMYNPKKEIMADGFSDIKIENERIVKDINGNNDYENIAIANLNRRIPIQYEDGDMCETCERPNDNLFCKACGCNWKVFDIL